MGHMETLESNYIERRERNSVWKKHTQTVFSYLFTQPKTGSQMTCFNIIIWTSAWDHIVLAQSRMATFRFVILLLGFLAKLIHFSFIVSSGIHQHIINLLQKVAKVGLQFPQHPPLSQGWLLVKVGIDGWGDPLSFIIYTVIYYLN